MELPYTIRRTQILSRTLHLSQAPEHLVGPWGPNLLRSAVE